MSVWSTELFGGLFEDENSIVACLLPTCALASAKSQLDGSSWVLNLFCSTICNPCASVSYRNQVRNKYGIRGSLTNDCVAGCCCQCCSTSQILREGKKKEKIKK
jgi:Cys-rich protein (TIGR01571 family)